MVEFNTSTGDLGALRTFLKQVGDSEIGGKKDSTTGHTTLYIKTEADKPKVGLGRSRTEATTAEVRTSIVSAFDRIPRDLNLNANKNIFHDIKARLDDPNSMRSDALLLLAKGMKHEIRSQSPQINVAAKREVGAKPEAGPKLAQLGDGFVAGCAKSVVGAVNHAAKLGEVAKTDVTGLGNAIAEAFNKGNPSAQARSDFALSSGAGLKAELREAFMEALSNDKKAAKLNGQHINGLVATAFNQAAAQILSDRVLPDSHTFTTIKDGKERSDTLPLLIIDKVVYTPTKFLASGGFGDVFEFTANDANQTKIAFKLAKPEKVTLEGAVAEIKAHQSAVGTGHSNVLEMKAVIRMPDGHVGIALESAPHGDVHKLAETIKNLAAADNNNTKTKLTPEQAEILRLTMLKDMIVGLHHIHEQGMIHFDFKGPNCLLGTDGNVKVADFGTTREGPSLPHRDSPQEMENPTWQSPEQCYAKSGYQLEPKYREIDEKFKTKKAELRNEFATVFKNFDTTNIKKKIESGREERREGRIDKIKNDLRNAPVTNKVDTWALGVTAFKVFTGEDFHRDTGFDTEKELRVAAFGRHPLNRALGTADNVFGEAKPFAQGTGARDFRVNDFINSLMAPVPADRPALTGMLDHPIFAEKGVGGPTARNLLKAIASNDEDAISRAKIAFNLAMGQTRPRK